MDLVSKRIAGGIRGSIADLEVDDKLLASAVMWYLIDWFATDPALTKTLDPRDWSMLGCYANGALDGALVNKLHTAHRHPDYEYDTTVTGRKQDGPDSPEGYGWEINWLFYDETAPGSLSGTKYQDFNRDDHTDTAWYRRLKTDAARDEVDPFDHDRPKITLERIKLYDVLKLVAEHTNSGYFPAPRQPSAPGIPTHNATETLTSAAYMTDVQICVAEIDSMTTPGTGRGRPEVNSKPHYIERCDFLNNLEVGPNCYHPSWDTSSQDGDVICRYNGVVTHKADPDSMYYYIEVPEADILINLKKPFTESFIRVNLKGVKERGDFRNWAHYCEVAVNPYTLKAAIELIS